MSTLTLLFAKNQQSPPIITIAFKAGISTDLVNDALNVQPTQTGQT